MVRRALIALAAMLGLVAGPAHAGLILTLDDTTFEGPSGTVFTLSGTVTNTGPDDAVNTQMVFIGGHLLFAPAPPSPFLLPDVDAGELHDGDIVRVQMVGPPGVYNDQFGVQFCPEGDCQNVPIVSNLVTLTLCIPECETTTGVPAPPSFVVVLAAGGLFLVGRAGSRSSVLRARIDAVRAWRRR